MSADNWTVCPRCKSRAEARLEANQDVVDGLYGDLDREIWLDLQAEVDAERAEGPYERATFREDYDFYGANEGTIHWSYSGYCSECELSIAFQDERQFYFEDEEELGHKSRFAAIGDPRSRLPE